MKLNNEDACKTEMKTHSKDRTIISGTVYIVNEKVYYEKNTKIKRCYIHEAPQISTVNSGSR
jgi:hypothetical protein